MQTRRDSSPLVRRRPPAALLLVGMLLLAVAGCGGEDGVKSASGTDTSSTSTSDADSKDDAFEPGDDDAAIDEAVAQRADSYDEPPSLKLDPKKTYIAKVSTTKGDFEFEVLPEDGPIAAANFVALARDGFFDGVKVHRIVKDFVIQTGDPLGSGTGGPGYSIADDEVKLPYERGVVAMANSGPDTGGSQFFIVLSNDAEFAPSYSIFGRVPEDQMQAVDAIAATPVEPGGNGEPSTPTEVIRVMKVEIEER